MKTLFCTILALLGCGSALANSNFVSNPYLPYPPGCARVSTSDAQGGPQAQAAKFFDDEIEMLNDLTGEQIPVKLEAYRSPCTEPNRSLIWLTFSLPESHAGKSVQLELPYAVAETAVYYRRGMNLVTEPGGWGFGGRVDRERTYLVSNAYPVVGIYAPPDVERKWVFLLDNGPATDESYSEEPGLSASEYNAAFKLILRYPPYDFFTINVPATSEVLTATPPRLPLSGRQSGIWVIEGAADQGFQLAISEPVGMDQDGNPRHDDLPLVIFFSQYTFDTESRPLWLVGNAEFEPGASEVTIPIVKVTNGEFRGSKRAEREIVGSVTLTSNSCNDVRFDFDYSSIGLGTGSRRLQRLFSLETAGYDCRDYEARTAAND
jgi:hypothetical protein